MFGAKERKIWSVTPAAERNIGAVLVIKGNGLAEIVSEAGSPIVLGIGEIGQRRRVSNPVSPLRSDRREASGILKYRG